MTPTNKADVFCRLARIAEQSPCHKSRLVALRWMARMTIGARDGEMIEISQCHRAGLPLPPTARPLLDSVVQTLAAIGRQLADLDLSDLPLDALAELLAVNKTHREELRGVAPLAICGGLPLEESATMGSDWRRSGPLLDAAVEASLFRLRDKAIGTPAPTIH